MGFKMYVRWLFATLLYVLLPCTAQAQTQVNAPTIDVGAVVVNQTGFQLLELIDPSQNLTIDQVKPLINNKSPRSSVFHYADVTATHWFAFNLYNSSDQTLTRIINLTESHPEMVNLYFMRDDHWTESKSGTTVPMAERPVKNRSAAFEVELAAKESATIYLATSSTKHRFIAAIEVKDPATFEQSSQFQVALYMLFFGACLSIIAYNILLFIFLRDRLYLFYIAYALCFFAFTLAFSGYDLYLHSSTRLHHILEASPSLAGAFFTLFVSQVLNSKNTMPRMHILLTVLIAISLILSLWALVDIKSLDLVVALSVPLPVFVTAVVIYAAVKKIPLASILVTGIMALSCGLFLIQANVYGILENNLVTRYSYMVGALIELLAFSLALAHKIKSTQEESAKNHKLLLEATHNANLKLEEKVEQRTIELEKATQKAEQANRAKGEFLTTINHEIRTPLNGILGMVDLLQQHDLPAKTKGYVTTLKTAGHHLSSLVNNVLDLSKMETGKVEITTSRFKLMQLLDELENIFASPADKKALALTFNLETDFETWQGDINRIRQVLINLIGNALKFTQQGSITVSVRLSEDRKHLYFDVTDTGAGIAPHLLNSIFGAYEQVAHHQINTQVGTGLGLTISKKLAIAMGGDIGIKSSLNQGSSFYLTLPMPMPNQAYSPQTIEATPSVAPQTQIQSIAITKIEVPDFSDVNLLLIEDSDINQQLIEAYLQPTGINITCYDNGINAITEFEKGGTTLVLTDFQMSTMDGIQVTQALRALEQQNNWEECPIILQTADVRASVKDDAISAGITDFLPKPYSQTQLMELLSQTLNPVSVKTIKLHCPNKLIALQDRFFAKADHYMATITEYITTQNTQDLSIEIHSLKGTSALFGGQELSTTLEKMEELMAYEATDWEGISKLFATAQEQLRQYRSHQ